MKRRPLLASALFAEALLFGAAITATPLVLSGCGAPCSTFDKYYSGGTVRRSDALVIYESSPVGGPFLAFGGGATYHIRHGMKITPQSFTIQLSFSEYPFQDGAGGFAPSAGNQTVILQATDQEVVVKNDSCATYYLRVVLESVPISTRSDAAISD
ncbi:MAG: hypothetical protein NVS3B20_25260 [Polyangiales bacterium]